MEDKNQLLHYLESFLGDSIKTSRNNHAFHCPFCQHHKKKLEVDLDSYVYNCWTCLDPPTKGSNFLYLLSSLGATSNILSSVKSHMNKELLAKWRAKREEKPKKITYTPITLPEEYVPLSESSLDYVGSLAYNYLTSERGLTPQQIDAFKIGYCSEGKYNGRLILPVFDKYGKVVYFNARNILPDKTRVKYYDPLERGSSVVKRSLVPMEFFVSTNYPVTIVEGVFDFYNTPNSIPLMGTNMFPGVLDFLISNDIEEVVLALDAGTMPKITRYAKMLLSFNINVSYVKLTGEQDPSSLGYNKMRNLINNNRVEVNTLELLKLKLYDNQNIPSF